MDPDNQTLVKALADEHGTDDLIVVLGATDPEALEVAAETVTRGDPSYIGPLSEVPLGLHVFHIFEDEIKSTVDAEAYDREIGFLEAALDADSVRSTMQRVRSG